ncbi:MAG TPA: hypothetical protein VN200_03650, partial [Rhodoglobus sp.]|nr:hypothetical protein [Rhodoglobus sp.]
ADAERDLSRAEGIALVEAATAGQAPGDPIDDVEDAADRVDDADPIADQASQQSDTFGERRRDPEY